MIPQNHGSDERDAAAPTTITPRTPPLAAARHYLTQHGWAPIPVPARSKNPGFSGWTTVRLSDEDLPRHFNGHEQNIGILLGEASQGLVDVDLDSPAARLLADRFLPSTPASFGRASTPRAHRLYRCPAVATTRLKDPTADKDDERACLVEIRATGCHTLFPPSVHPSGEAIAWNHDGEPPMVERAILLSGVQRLAAADLVARHWPGIGSRHDAALALAGGLLHGGWSESDTERFIRAVADAAGDEEVDDRVAAVGTTARAMAEGRNTVGWPRLAEMIDGRVIDKVREWFGLRDAHLILAVTPTPPVTVSEALWPVLDPAALHGIVGEVVGAIEPHTEADPVAILVNFLVMAGSAIGRGPHARVGAARHGVNEFVVTVGETARARKGTSLAEAKRIVTLADLDWAARIMGGLSSGEGLIHVVRDPVYKTSKEGEEYCADPGVDDKRALVVEPEFAAVLRVAGREGNTLSPLLRRAWDGDDLQTMTRAAPIMATAPHISIIGNITHDELLRELSESYQANGFANRFLFFLVRRSKLLPHGGALTDAAIAGLAQRVTDALLLAKDTEALERDAETNRVWEAVYPALVEERRGMLGAITARAEAHVLRLSLLYAVLDGAWSIHRPHLEAALAICQYAEDSARYLFGDATGDPIADRVLTALRRNGAMTQTEIVELFGRNIKADRLNAGLELLLRTGKIHSERTETGGRPRTTWEAVP